MNKKFLYAVLLVVLISVGGEVACQNGWFKAGEDRYYDLWHQLAGRRYEPRHTVIAAIDDQTRLEHADEPLVFWGPHFAKALSVLHQAGARVMGLDFIFVVSAEAWLKKLKLPESSLSRTFDLPLREQLAAGQVVLAGDLAMDAQRKAKFLLPPPDYWGVLPGGLEDVGLVNFFFRDQDGVLRSWEPAYSFGGGVVWVTFAQLLADKYAGKKFTGKATTRTPIAFAGPPGTIPRISFRKLLTADALRDPQVRGLKDKVVIIAYEPSEVQDKHQTPYARLMSGPEVHANIVETILTGRSPRPVPLPYRLVYLVILFSLAVFLFYRFSPIPGLAALVLLALGAAACSYVLFLSNWLLPTAIPQLGLLAGYLGILGLRLTGEERERARLQQIFGRYVSGEVVEKLLASGQQPDLGGEAFTVTVLFSDIRNFTTISESLDPQEVVEMLNTYFSRACEPILTQGGMVDKFIGDAVMAVFGAPASQADHARRAITAALALVEKAKEFQAWMALRFPDRGLQDFHVGVGLHTGEAVVGNIGSPARFEFTAIGDTVNLASRLEGLTKELGWTIIASEAAVQAAGPGVVLGGRQEVKVKGRQEPVVVMEVQGLEAKDSF